MLLSADECFGREFDHALAAEEFEENSDALASRHGARDDGLQTVESAARDVDGVAWFERFSHDVNFIGADCGAKFGNDGIGHGGPLVAEMDDAADALDVPHQADGARKIESGEKVVGKERLCEPNRAAAGGAFKADTREIDLDLGMLFEMSGRNVLVFGLGAEAKPGPQERAGCGFSGVHCVLLHNKRLQPKLRIPSFQTPNKTQNPNSKTYAVEEAVG